MKNQNPWLLVLICLFLILSACSPVVTPPGLTAMIPGKTSTVAPATPISSPTVSPEATEIPFVIPTSTFLAPTPVASSHYRLKRWTPELANELIETLYKYPDGLGDGDRGYHDGGYYYAYVYAAFAAQEAQLLLPHSRNQEQWAWDAAYHLSQSDGDEALKSYLDLIGQALTTGATTVSHLESWFKGHETRLQLKVTSLAGKPENNLLEIADPSERYGGFLWVIKNQGKFSVYPLHGNDVDYAGDFYPESADGISFELNDITGDGIAEIITVHKHWHGVGRDFITTGLDVFDISHGSPERLLFTPDVSYTRDEPWSVLKENNQGVGLAFDFYRSECLVPFHEVYRWNGKRFDLASIQYPDKQQILNNFGKECFNNFVSTLTYYFSDDKADTLKEWHDLIVDWPSPTEQRSDDENLPDARDKLRFQAALYLALNGDVSDARQESSTIVENPVVPNSQWVAPAKTFLANFNAAGDLPKTCLALKRCAEFFDVGTLTDLAATKPQQNPIDFLQEIGAIVKDHASIDVNNDGQIDFWLMLDEPSYHSEYLPIWIFVSTKDGYQPVLLGYYPKDGVKSLKVEPAFQGSPVLTVESTDEVDVYTLQADSKTSKLDALHMCGVISSALYDIKKDLLKGGKSAVAIEKLSALMPEIGRACPNIDYVPARARYLLGLADELAGDSAHAAENYFVLWQSYPPSPFALMAQAKLEAAP